MRICIEFNLKERDYDQYEGIIQEFLNNMNDLGYDEINVLEDKNEEC